MGRSTIVTAVSLLLFATAVPSVAQSRADFDVTLEDVALRPGVTADIHVQVFVNEEHPCQGKTIFAVHGLAHTAATWAPLAESLFADNPTGRKACRVAAIDLPGHGESGLPEGLLFGNLLLDDYVAALRGTIERLIALNVRPVSILAHSQGGLLVPMLQQALVDAGTSLRTAFNVKQVVLLAPVPSRGIPWLLVDSGAAEALLAAFQTSSPELGDHLSIPDADWVGLFFTNLFGQPVPGAPTPAEVAANGWNAPAPLLSSLQLVGFGPFERPLLDPGIFASGSGTALQVAAYEQDILIRPDEAQATYELLSGDGTLAAFVVVPGPHAVHDLHVADPAGLLAAIAGTVELP